MIHKKVAPKKASGTDGTTLGDSTYFLTRKSLNLAEIIPVEIIPLSSIITNLKNEGIIPSRSLHHGPMGFCSSSRPSNPSRKCSAYSGQCHIPRPEGQVWNLWGPPRTIKHPSCVCLQFQLTFQICRVILNTYTLVNTLKVLPVAPHTHIILRISQT